MKKSLCYILSLLLLSSLVACGSTGDESKAPDESSTVSDFSSAAEESSKEETISQEESSEEPSVEESSEEPVKEPVTMPEIKEYIQRYAREPITNECVAKAFGYHSYYLNRLMKQYGGITIAQMVIQERIKYAEMCMTTTDMTIAEIAVASGFSNISYFSRIFREKTGNTPSQYRKSNAI